MRSHTSESPVEFRGSDAETLLNHLFADNVQKIKQWRCGYGIACLKNSGIIVNGVLLGFSSDHFWYVQSDDDFVK